MLLLGRVVHQFAHFFVYSVGGKGEHEACYVARYGFGYGLISGGVWGGVGGLICGWVGGWGWGWIRWIGCIIAKS
jgi:hypothetical protein